MFSARRFRSLAVIGALGLVPLAACGGPDPAGEASQTGTAAPGRTDSAAGPAPRFSTPTDVDNRMFPLRPGTQFEYRGKVVEGGGSEPHSVIFTVTDVTKVVNGVRTVVAWDRDIRNGERREVELAFFAQDDAGNVWNFGEYPEEYENGKFAGAPNTWIRGANGGYGGRHMLAQPRVGAQYVEGRIPAIDFHDVSRITRVDHSTCVPSGCYQRVLMVTESSPATPAVVSRSSTMPPESAWSGSALMAETRRNSSACTRYASSTGPRWVKSGQRYWRWTAARTGSARCTGSPSRLADSISSAPAGVSEPDAAGRHRRPAGFDCASPSSPGGA